MISLGTIVKGAAPTESGFTATIPDSWLQGRTAYGGLSAALAFEAALRSEPDLPPLRSAQIAFIGPLAGEVTVTATRLRRGKNAAFIQSDVLSEAGLGFRATFIFMNALASAIDHDTAAPAPIAPPSPGTELYVGPENFFTGNFEFYDPKAADGPAEWLRWARLRDRDGLHPMTELLAIGDGLPPAAFKLFEKQTPLSSLNWQINMIADRPAAEDGWYLLHAHADRARSGFSSQRMTIWNSDGAPVAEAMQAVAIFG